MKILVAHSSKRGSTAEIAEVIAATLRREGLEVECEPAEDIGDLSPYDGVVLGSSVYVRRWRGEARHFLRKHRKELARMPFWIFSSGPVGDPFEDQPEWSEPPKIVEAAQNLGARDHVVFGGCLPAEPKGPIEMAMVASTPPEYRDRRDWDEILDWTMAVAGDLRGVVPAA